MTRNSADRAQPEPRVVGGQPEDLPHGPRGRRRRQRRRVGLRQRAAGRVGGRRLDRRRGASSQSRARSARATPPPPRGPPPATPPTWLVASSSAKRARLAQRAGLEHRAVGQHDHLVAAPHRGQPVRDDDADPVAQQPFGGPLHPGLGDRVHPRGGLVEDHHVRVADQDPGERDQLLLPGRQHVAALAEPGLHAVGQVGRPRRSGPARAAPARPASSRSGSNSAMFSASVPARISVRCGTTAIHRRSPSTSRSTQVGAAEEHRAAAARRPPGSAPWPASTCPSRCARSARTSGRGRRSRLDVAQRRPAGRRRPA